MNKVSISQLQKRAVSYTKDTPVALDVQLRRAVLVGGAGAAVGLLGSLFFLPVLRSWAYQGFFWFLGDLAVGALYFLASPIGLIYNVLILGSLALLWVMTNGLKTGKLVWHNVAFGVGATGAVDLAIVGLPVLSVVLNVIAWVVAIVVGMALGLLVLAILLGGLSS